MPPTESDTAVVPLVGGISDDPTDLIRSLATVYGEFLIAHGMLPLKLFHLWKGVFGPALGGGSIKLNLVKIKNRPEGTNSERGVNSSK